MSRSRARGTAAESRIVDYLRARGFRYAERRALAGARDRGDVAGIPGVVIEAKDCTRQTLGEWVDEARVEAANAGVPIGVVWAKRRGKTDPGRWFVLMDGETFVSLIADEPAEAAS